MVKLPDCLNALRPLQSGSRSGYYYSLPALEKAGLGSLSRLPVCLRIVLESVLRNCDGERIGEAEVKALAAWKGAAPGGGEIPFVVSRIILQDFTGVPLLVDLAAMRDAMAELGHDPALIEPRVPVDLVIDHSVQVDRAGTPDAFSSNLKIEFERNRERYQFLKWGQEAFETFNVVPPSIGIVHQVNLEHLAPVVFEKKVGEEWVFYPDTLVGTDSHTTMINGLGVVGWGVGGIEAEAGMLGQPIYFLTPEVLGVHLRGELREGVTATDLTLRVTQMLRKENVVGKFVEFFGAGASRLTLPDRATIANMAPEYGATMGFFPVDGNTLEYLRMTGRPERRIQLIRDYYEAQEMFGIPREGDIDYTKTIDLDLDTIVPCVAGPKRPQDRIDVPRLKETFRDLLEKAVEDGGYGIGEERRGARITLPERDRDGRAASPGTVLAGSSMGHGSILIAAITSCTNTSNPSVMIAAGLLAKKAVQRGLSVEPMVKTSLAPGSRVVSDYLEATGLQVFLDKLGFNLVGYGCTTCIGNSGPLDPAIENAVREEGLITASVLSGNRNFEARVHSSIKANFLMSPPLVVAYALAGRVDLDLEKEPLGKDWSGEPVYLKDLWPSREEINEATTRGLNPEMFRSKYADIFNANPEWKSVETRKSVLFNWKEESTYIQNPPFFEGMGLEPVPIRDFRDMRVLAAVGDSVTTDHISPAGAIPAEGPAGRYLIAKGVAPGNFNSFGSRRGNDRVMARGTFANVRFKNRLADGKEGGWTRLFPEGTLTEIHEAARLYRERKVPLIVFAGHDYGMGSSRDWAAKGPALLGVRAVAARSFERIHRSNLIGMGVLPLEFRDGESFESLHLEGRETFSLLGIDRNMKPLEEVILEIKRPGGEVGKASLILRIDTPIEVEYYLHGGILPYVLRSIIHAREGV